MRIIKCIYFCINDIDIKEKLKYTASCEVSETLRSLLP